MALKGCALSLMCLARQPCGHEIKVMSGRVSICTKLQHIRRLLSKDLLAELENDMGAWAPSLSQTVIALECIAYEMRGIVFRFIDDLGVTDHRFRWYQILLRKAPDRPIRRE